MSDDKKRELFEKWMKENKKDLKNPLELTSKGNYKVRATQLRFEGFIAALDMQA